MRIIAIVNQKGGCGKTTTAINLAGVMAKLGRRTLLVDLDPQSHCAAGLAIPEQRIDVQIGDAMMARPEQTIDWTRLLWRVGRCLDLAPSTVRLAALESARGGLVGAAGSERRLAGVLSRLADQYDVCLIDCPPNIGLLTYNALAAATEVIVPVETAFFALQGAAKQVSAIKSLSKRMIAESGAAGGNGAIAGPVVRILPTMHDPGSTLAKDVLEELSRRFGESVLPVTVRFDHRLKEAVSFGQPIVEYAGDAAGAADYLALGQHLLGEGKGKGGAAGRLDSLTRGGVSPAVAAQSPRPPALDPVQTRAAAAAEFFARGGVAGAGAGAGGSPSHLPTPPGMTMPVIDIALTETKPGTVGASSASLTAEDVRGRLLELTSRVTKLADKARPEPGAGVAVIEPLTLVPTTAAPTSAAALTASQGLLGVKITSAGVLFVQPLSAGKSVAIAGDFNGWSPASLPMVRNDKLGVFERLVPIPAGRWQYRLVIDGHWTHDAQNPVHQPNPFGGLNSMIDVPATPGRL